jgi:hypothetical protein
MRVSNRAVRRVLKLGLLAAADLSGAGTAFPLPGLCQMGGSLPGGKRRICRRSIFQFALSPYAYWQSLA